MLGPLRALSDVAYDAGDIDASEAHLLAALALLSEDDARWLCSLRTRIATLCVARSDMEGTAHWLKLAMFMDEPATDVRTGSEVLQLSAVLAALRGKATTAVQIGTKAIHLVNERRFPWKDRFDVLLDAQMAAIRARMSEGDFAAASEYGRALSFREAIEHARQWIASA
jgi:hypothetical protein